MNIKVLGTLMACLMMAACSSQDDADKAPDNTTDDVTVSDNQAENQVQTTSDAIVGKQWQLVVLEGRQVDMAENQQQPVYFELHNNNNQVTGFAGCNTLNGTYTLEEGQRIRFTQMLTTLKACPDVDVDEQAFLEVFELTDNYTLQDGQLSLNVGRRAPLAVFEEM